MFDTTKPRGTQDAASAFIASTDAWAEAGRAIELAHRQLTPIGQVVRQAVMTFAAKLRSREASR